MIFLKFNISVGEVDEPVILRSQISFRHLMMFFFLNSKFKLLTDVISLPPSPTKKSARQSQSTGELRVTEAPITTAKTVLNIIDQVSHDPILTTDQINQFL